MLIYASKNSLTLNFDTSVMFQLYYVMNLMKFSDKNSGSSHFSRRLIEFYAGNGKGREAWSLARQFRTAIRNDDLEGFMALFQSFLADISYELRIPQEKYYQTVFFIEFKLLGASIEAESRTNEGSIDAYIKTVKTVYVFEFKLDRSAEAAVS